MVKVARFGSDYIFVQLIYKCASTPEERAVFYIVEEDDCRKSIRIGIFTQATYLCVTESVIAEAGYPLADIRFACDICICSTHSSERFLSEEF